MQSALPDQVVEFDNPAAVNHEQIIKNKNFGGIELFPNFLDLSTTYSLLG